MDQQPLENIVKNARKEAPLLSALVQSVGPFFQRKKTSYSSQNSTCLQLVSMKIVAILIIFYQSVHQNNSNYIPLLIAFHMYSASAHVDTITLFNYLGLFVSYDVLQKRLKDIINNSLL